MFLCFFFFSFFAFVFVFKTSLCCLVMFDVCLIMFVLLGLIWLCCVRTCLILPCVVLCVVKIFLAILCCFLDMLVILDGFGRFYILSIYFDYFSVAVLVG